MIDRILDAAHNATAWLYRAARRLGPRRTGILLYRLGMKIEAL